MRKNILLLLFISFLLLSACGSRPQEVRVENQYQLLIPAGLKKVDDLDPKASLQYADYHRELYVSLNQIPKTELMKTLGAAQITSEGIPDLLTYSKLMASSFKYTVNASEIELEEMGSNYWLEFEGETPKAKLYYQVAYAEDEAYFYQLIVWTLAKEKEKHKEKMLEVIKSFEII